MLKRWEGALVSSACGGEGGEMINTQTLNPHHETLNHEWPRESSSRWESMSVESNSSEKGECPGESFTGGRVNDGEKNRRCEKRREEARGREDKRGEETERAMKGKWH